MSRRELPPRSSRGHKPQLNARELEEDDAFYSKLFGVSSVLESQNQIENKKQRMRQGRKEQLTNNLSNYSYVRAHHYFFDLDTFLRVEGNPSYAADLHNAFGWHFSQDEKNYKGTQLSKIINRIYFGLPHTSNREKEQDNSKNVCHGVLFDGEDKKYNLQRMIYTCKRIRQQLQKLVQTGDIKNFKNIVKKQPELQKLLNQQESLVVKKELLSKVIQNLQEKKEMNCEGHYYEDKLHFYFSLDQIFHNQASKVQEQILPLMIPIQLYNNQRNYMLTIKQTPDAFPIALKYILRFHQSSISAVSEKTIDQLANNYPKLLLQCDQIKPLINLPCAIFYFGNLNVIRILDNIISLKISKVHGDLGYYTAKFAWLKLFKRELVLIKPPPKQKYVQYKVKIQAFVELLKDYMKIEREPEVCKYLNAFDEKINWEQLNSPNQQQISLLKKTNPMEISEKQIMITFLYSWLYKSLSKIYRVIEQTPDYANLFTSQHFVKHHLQILQVVHQPYFGIFNSALGILVEFIMKADTFFNLKQQVQFDYNIQSRTGILWKKPLVSDDQWIQVQSFHQVQEDQEKEQNQGNIPKKKVKQNTENEI